MALFLSSNERQVLAGFAICVVMMAVLHEVVQLKELAETVQTQLLEDHYATLNIQAAASAAEISTAFKRATNQIHSKPQTLESQQRLAFVNGAYQTLSNPQSRAAYDQQRQIVIAASGVLSTALVGMPLMAVAYLIFRFLLNQRGAKTELDPESFAGKVAASLSQIEASLELQLQRDASSQLGMRLAPVKAGSMLQICGIASGGVVEEHNRREATAGGAEMHECSSFSPAGSVWWELPVLRESDIIASVNGKTGHEAMMGELKSSGSLAFGVQRPLRGGASVLPWLCEAELHRNCGNGERWGCELAPSKDSSGTLEVKQVSSQGAVARWNETHPRLAIRAGDRVLAVDHQIGSEQMLTALRSTTAESSNWLVTRGVLVPSGTLEAAPKEIVCGPFNKSDGEKLGIRIGQCLEAPLRGSIVEPSCAGSMVVKEVVSGFLVDRWNQTPGVSKVLEGSIVLAVNNCDDPKQFGSELSKPSVKIKLRPPRITLRNGHESVSSAASTAEGSGKPKQVNMNFEDVREPLASRILGSWAPSFLLPASFESKLRETLRHLRCEFSVELKRSDPDMRRVGLQLSKGSLEVVEVAAGGLVHNYNLHLDKQGCLKTPRVRAGDRLVAANGITEPRRIIEQLAATGNSDSLILVFSRPAAQAAPGVWEVDVQRQPDEGWGMELKELYATTARGPRSAGVLQVNKVVDGMAIDRWNEQQGEGQQWKVQAGDVLIACEPEVGAGRVLEKLRNIHRARLVLLAWHRGPAPEPPEQNGAVSTPKQRKTQFEVTIKRSGSERLGLRLNPSSRDPTRTEVSEIVPGGLVDLHNQALGGQHDPLAICIGDEVDAVNGEGNPDMFPVCCQQPVIVFRLTRRSGLPPPSKKEVATPAVIPAPFPTATSTPIAPEARQARQDNCHTPALEARQMGASTPVAPEITPTPQTAETESPQPLLQQPDNVVPEEAEVAESNVQASSSLRYLTENSVAAEALPEDASPTWSEDMDRHPHSAPEYVGSAFAGGVAVPMPDVHAGMHDELISLRAERDRLSSETSKLQADAQRAERSAAAARRALEQDAERLREELSKLRSEASGLEEQLRQADTKRRDMEARLDTERRKRIDAEERAAQALSSAPNVAAAGTLSASHDPLLLEPIDDGIQKLQDLSVAMLDLLASEDL
eukprot:TRINITY_DN75231_c0_g1_i1.p1 TRINITY_DN75231_c0_g1~~TRINITY_DN75231_c0_g1_i1.p1  ORF type:complete len:1160 (+),score=215.32 TRINITY_DN75231_c0_g1_i1:50-3529(+)